MADRLDIEMMVVGPPTPAPSPTASEDEYSDTVEEVARQILDELEYDLDMDAAYDLDLHWQSEPVDYGRMAVRRLSQELAGVDAVFNRRSSDVSTGSGHSSRRVSVFGALSRRGSAADLLEGAAVMRDWTQKSMASRRMSMDPTVLGQASRPDRRCSDAGLGAATNGLVRRFSHGTIDEVPEVSISLDSGGDDAGGGEEREGCADPGGTQRRGGISFEKTDKNALYVRMLGDVKVQTKPVISRERRRSSLLDSDLRMLENLDLSQYKMRFGHKFYSLHQVRRRARGPCRQSATQAAILDDHYGGQARCLLSTVGDWHFNVFSLDKLTNGRSLFHMALHIFQELNLIEKFQLDIIKLMRCFTLIEDGYHSNNPYHNAVHAADVSQSMYCFLKEAKLAANVTPLETMVAILAALTHDLDHPGVNQAFLISTSNHLAALYKNSSVLENHHWRSAMCVIHESRLFSHLDQQTVNAIECQIRSLILATDITRQQEFLNQFKRQQENNELNLTKADHRHFTLQIVLKCADICNPCRPWEVSKRWSEQICDEFFQQGDYERQLHLSVTPNCDRYKTTVGKIQSGFIQYVVSPLFTEWHHFSPSGMSNTMLKNMHQNKVLWDSIIAKAEAAPPAVVVHTSCHQEAGSDGDGDEDEEQAVPEMIMAAAASSAADVVVVAVDSSCKENVHHCADLPEDTVLEGRFDLPERGDDLLLLPGCALRRHSLPSSQRRTSLPKLKLPQAPARTSRRHSLPVSTNAGALDRLAEKLVVLADKERRDQAAHGRALCQRPNIANLSSEIEATFRLSSLSALLAARAAGNTGTLIAGRLSPSSTSPPSSSSSSSSSSSAATSRLKTANPVKEVTFDMPFPVKTAKAPAGGLVARPGGSGVNHPCGGRQVLKPLNTNREAEGRPRGRSGSAEFSNHWTRQFHGVLFDRPRSLSLEHESQPLLRSIGEWRTLPGDEDTHHDNFPTTPPGGYNNPELDITMSSGHALEESSLTMPLLDHHPSHSTRQSHMSPT